jgi:exoribonuclease-2
MRKYAAVAIMRDRIGGVFDAIVTGASPKGTYVRLLAPPVEGRVMRGEQGMDVGDRVRVRLIGASEVTGFIDFARA